MSDCKKITTKQYETDEPDNSELMDKILLDERKELKTNITNECRFDNKQDKYVWDHLPLTLKQKEELLLSLFSDIKLNN